MQNRLLTRRGITALIGLMAAWYGGGSGFAHAGLPRFETIALTGQQVPGAAPGVVFDGFQLGDFNNPGHVAFTATLTGPGVDRTNDVGFYSNRTGTLAKIARSGDQAPGADSGVVFEIGFNNFKKPSLNDLGETAFPAGLTGPGVVPGTTSFGLYRSDGNALVKVARAGDQVPGAEPGVVHGRFNEDAPLINNAGQIAFTTSLEGPTITDLNSDGLFFADSDGSVSKVFLHGEQPPGGSAGETFSGFPRSFFHGFNDAGQIAITASVDVGQDFNESRLYLGVPGAMKEIARKGDPAPGATPGVVFSGISQPNLNNAGQIAFRSRLTGPGVDVNDAGIYATDLDGELFKIAGRDDPAPGIQDDAQFTGYGFNLYGQTLNDAGQVVFTGVASNSFGNASPSIYLYEDGSITQASFRDTVFYTINNSGQITLFTSNIEVIDTDGQIIDVVRGGERINVSSNPDVDDVRTIEFVATINTQRFDADQSTGLNDQGQVAFWARFTDGSEGILIGNAAVPEPGSALLLYIGAFSLACRRR